MANYHIGLNFGTHWTVLETSQEIIWYQELNHWSYVKQMSYSPNSLQLWNKVFFPVLFFFFFISLGNARNSTKSLAQTWQVLFYWAISLVVSFIIFLRGEVGLGHNWLGSGLFLVLWSGVTYRVLRGKI